ncbi:MAG: O-methyltransferase [Cyclobacteriaceae bacterium]
MGKLSLLQGYLSYWLHAVNQHSLHAPRVYEFYTQIILKDQPQQDFEAIEALREDLLHDKRKIRVNSPGAPSQVASSGERSIRHIARHGMSSPRFCRLLYRMARWQQARTIIELGTSLGITTLYLAAACPKARIYTFEGCRETAEVARRHFKLLNRNNIELIEGNIDEQLPPLISRIDQFDLAYLDANHRYAPTLHYYELLRSKSHPTSVIVLDDLYWSAGMSQAWKELRQRPEVSLSLDLFDAGLLFFHPARQQQHHALIW